MNIHLRKFRKLFSTFAKQQHYWPMNTEMTTCKIVRIWKGSFMTFGHKR